MINTSPQIQLNAPQSKDHVIDIDINKDIVLALDKDGKELCRFCFEISGHNIYFKTPTVRDYPGYSSKLAKLFVLLSQYAGNLEIPENLVKFYNDPSTAETWENLSAVAVTARSEVKKLIYELFFKYLNGFIEGVENKYRKQRKWFENNAQITDVQKLFSACLCVEQLVKKNSEIILEREYNLKSQGQSSKPTLVKNQRFQSKKSTNSPSSSLELH